MTSSHRTVTRCLVCGFSEIRTDEVVDLGLVLLSECPRCRHRWTTRQTSLRRVTQRIHLAEAREVPTAA